MVTMSTASRPLSSGRLGLHALLVAMLIAVQATALSHEFEHLLHLHDAPCGLHVAAEHLVIVSAPAPALAVPLVPATGGVSLVLGLLQPPPLRPSTARAPPLLSC
jgi:hypothetical protein